MEAKKIFRILLARKNLLIILAVIIIFCALGFFVIHQMTTTYNAHNTFDGYCKWRGLVVVNKFSDYGYCQDLCYIMGVGFWMATCLAVFYVFN